MNPLGPCVPAPRGVPRSFFHTLFRNKCVSLADQREILLWQKISHYHDSGRRSSVAEILNKIILLQKHSLVQKFSLLFFAPLISAWKSHLVYSLHLVFYCSSEWFHSELFQFSVPCAKRNKFCAASLFITQWTHYWTVVAL